MMSFLILIAVVACFSAILALALNLQWGLGGMVNFGLAGFYALGSYAFAILAVRLQLDTFSATLAAMAVVAAVCGLVALVTLRVAEEDYFAIVTLGAGEMLRLAILNADGLTQGAQGMSGIPRPFASLVSNEWQSLVVLGVAAGALLLTLWFLESLARSPFGRLVRAVREDDLVAATLGKNVLWVRVRVFAIGGAIIGLAGSLHSMYYQYVDPTQFATIAVAYSFMAIIAGGRGAHRGTALGAAAVLLLLEGTRFVSLPGLGADQVAAIRIIVIGACLIGLLVHRPQGFYREYRLQTRLD
jgi:branched-chain amino acid transport system permease protein